MSATKELRERRLNVWEQMKELLSDTATEGMDGEQSHKYAEFEAEEHRLRNDIEARERAAKLEAALEKPQDLPDGIHEDRLSKPYDNEKQTYAKAFRSYMTVPDLATLPIETRQILARGTKETRDLSTGVGSAGGYLVPEQFSNQIFLHRKYFGGVRDVAGQITTSSGGDLMWPNNDDTSNTGAIVGEGGTVTELDVSFKTRTFKAFKYTSLMVQVTIELLQDSAFALDGFLAERFGERIGRIENTHMTTGTGAVQPEGFVTNGTTVATATSDTTVLKDIVTLIYSVDRAYRINGSFMMNDAVIAHLRKEQATTGEFVWQPSAQAGEPDRLFGYPVTVNNDMAATPTTDAAKVAAFGDFKSGYMIRDVAGISVVRLMERYAENGLVAFMAFARLDAQPTFSTTSSVPPYKILLVA